MSSQIIRLCFSPTGRLFLLMVLLCQSAGCSVHSKLSAWKPPERANELLISYTVRNAVRELDPWSSFADQGLESASWSSSSESESAAPRAAALQIQYPHPERGEEYALATLLVFDKPLKEEQFTTSSSKRWYQRFLVGNYIHRNKETEKPSPSEIVTLQIPRTQFELLFHEMDQSRYLDEEHPSKRSFSTALLSITKNRKSIRESIVEEPRLNEVIQNVYRNGEVVLGERRQAAPSILQTSVFIEAPNPTVVN